MTASFGFKLSKNRREKPLYTANTSYISWKDIVQIYLLINFCYYNLCISAGDAEMPTPVLRLKISFCRPLRYQRNDGDIAKYVNLYFDLMFQHNSTFKPKSIGKSNYTQYDSVHITAKISHISSRFGWFGPVVMCDLWWWDPLSLTRRRPFEVKRQNLLGRCGHLYKFSFCFLSPC